MLANFEQTQSGYIARFERRFRHEAQDVWAMLTDNEKLTQWFGELRVEELREGGAMLFDMGDGAFERMTIMAMTPQAVLEYEWGEDRVRFELEPQDEGSSLILIETIGTVTAHTARDLAGWQVCLDVIAALLDGRPIPQRKEEWARQYAEYAKLTESYLA
ncbi:SRPBCC family protein [Paenibacillus xanthanilyticus]|uniref:SRPBCC family protein n=1 Tax=Paenibacillus xanthanilyticus TaxID=1783531 RepID=A0ABV8KDH1_9BACL